MIKKNSSGSGIFLMEMILVVFFFVICAVICIRVFVKANDMSRTARDLNQSVLAAESIAEIWKQEGGEGLEKRMQAAVPAKNPDSAGIYWNQNWQPAKDQEQAAFVASISWQETEEWADAVIAIERTQDSHELFTMAVSRYRQIP